MKINMELLPEKFWTIAEIAELLDVSSRAVWGWTADGRLASVKVGRLRRITTASLAAFLAGEKEAS